MSNKETALQIFWDKIALKLSVEQINEFLPEFDQAKEIEKQQIIDAITQYEIKYNNVFSEQGILNVVNKAEQYYKQTFKSK